MSSDGRGRALSEQELLDRIDELWPTISQAYRANACILITRTAIEVASYFGFRWHPLPVDLALFNKPGWEAYKAELPMPQWAPEAWSLGCVCKDELDADGWSGHLLVEGDGWVADLDARQFNRPAKNIELTNWALDTAGQEPPWTLRQGDLTFWLRPRPEVTAYRRAKDWRSSYQALAAQLIRLIKETT
jgi:hypothetical protein